MSSKSPVGSAFDKSFEEEVKKAQAKRKRVKHTRKKRKTFTIFDEFTPIMDRYEAFEGNYPHSKAFNDLFLCGGLVILRFLGELSEEWEDEYEELLCFVGELKEKLKEKQKE